MERFWEILDERLELCHRALRCRHERLLGTVSDVAPILWQNGALARLKKGETIDSCYLNDILPFLLAMQDFMRMCMRMLGKSHTDPEAKPFALQVNGTTDRDIHLQTTMNIKSTHGTRNPQPHSTASIRPSNASRKPHSLPHINPPATTPPAPRSHNPTEAPKTSDLNPSNPMLPSYNLYVYSPHPRALVPLPPTTTPPPNILCPCRMSTH